jgi:FHS family L-fucose permease-like MFS transporter
MGFIADRFGTPAAFVIPALCFALVAAYGWKGAEVHDRSGSSEPLPAKLS